MDDLAEAALQAAVVRTLRAAAAVASEPEDLGTSRGPTGAGAASTVVTEPLDVSSPSSAADATSSTEPPSNDGASSEVNGAQVPAAPGSCEEGEDAGGPKPDAGPMDTGEDGELVCAVDRPFRLRSKVHAALPPLPPPPPPPNTQALVHSHTRAIPSSCLHAVTETPAELVGLAGTVIPVFTSQVAAYLQRLGHSCRVSAELAGRVDSNLLDAELALVRELSWGKEEFAELREFASELSTAVHSADLAEPSSTPNSPSSFDVGRGTSSAAAELQGSGAGRETSCLETLQVEQEEPSRLADIARPMQNVLQASEKAIPKPTYVPEYLPEYPDPHTFKQTPVYEAVLTDFEIWRKRRSTLKDTARSNLTQ